MAVHTEGILFLYTLATTESEERTNHQGLQSMQSREVEHTVLTAKVITSTSLDHKLPLLGSCWKKNIQFVDLHDQRKYFIFHTFS